MKKTCMALCLAIAPFLSSAQQTIYEVTAGNGNGIRFWQSDFRKMHMGIDASIKLNMDATHGRGWTWGHARQTPIAA